MRSKSSIWESSTIPKSTACRCRSVRELYSSSSGLKVGSVVDSVIFLSLAFGSLDFVVGQVIGKFWMSLIAGAMILAWRRRNQFFHNGISAA